MDTTTQAASRAPEDYSLAELEELEDRFRRAFLNVAEVLTCRLRKAGRGDDAFTINKRMFAMTDNPEAKALLLVRQGILMEEKCDFESAVEFYSQAILLEPKENDTWYFAHNNAGYSMVMLSRYVDAEKYCRTAVEINSQRHNAYKNLGLALEGQDRFAEAARMFAEAALRCPADPRALGHLEALRADHPRLAEEYPEVDTVIERCREAARSHFGQNGGVR